MRINFKIIRFLKNLKQPAIAQRLSFSNMMLLKNCSLSHSGITF
ncbi:hypothetical protein XAC3810_480005 [Xanthomonas citri pv. citri]|uniref:Uncharacterized protein n=1 Tax=Xanthomonas citri pv. citri TaxID=611301 RepID=A0A0U5FIR4_XANCI|nr:hypothetical protein XAC3824_1050005 [Xanthomonas citri pv. citri]CEE22799.1 hypothetical protein XAC2911_1020003 [Xanthomonas citri pv. citri]CEE29591.1 hypothetical protein XAC9322_490005 [Xanthomonas citri pv. citri]CEE31216.1 hypothetical protein XAC1083_480005 [Xanthomonas citri pv. citri]CEE40594.1 hypothetical protein XAC3810_480005 [Xanthomonas citri pv. citri]